MTTAAELEILLTGKDQSASDTIDKVEKKAGGLGDTMKSVGTVASGFLAANVVQAGVGAVTGFIGDSIAAIKDSIQVNAQLEAGMQSIGANAWTTADHIKDLAGSIEKNSLFEDEAIEKGQTLLLTFGNIQNKAGEGNDIFDQTSQIMVDMAQKMGTDASGAAIQLGKALNDPANGLTALSRAGVSFTDEQKDQIKAMQEAGDMAGAQKAILAELNKEFGGSAKAASDAAGASEVYKDKMNDLQEEIGTKMLPINEKLMQAKIALITLLTDKVIPVIEELYAKYWPSLSAAIGEVVAFIQTNWPLIQPIIEFAANFVKTQIEGMIQVIQGVVEVVTGVIDLVSALFHGQWSEAWAAMQQIAEGILDIFIGNIKRMFGSIPGIIIDLAGRLADEGYNMGKRLADSVVNGIGNLAQRVADKLSIAGVSVGDVAKFVGVPGFDDGGIVPGPLGAPRLIMAHGGETILPTHKDAGAGVGGLNIQFLGPVSFGGDEASARTMIEATGYSIATAARRRGV